MNSRRDERLQALERRQRSEVGHAPPANLVTPGVVPPLANPQLAECVAPSDAPYPTAGRVFPIRLVHGTFAERAEAALATTPRSASASRWCYNLLDELPPLGTILDVFAVGGRWYSTWCVG